MRGWVIGLGIVAALVGAGAFAWHRYWTYVPGLLNDWSDPVGPNHAVTWASTAQGR